ncbi:FadR/GntR family transcriptional regulator [Comamonas sp. J-3]|uniref:FadR/GntR family transcriptional regulator n=1 Tax=Comamonas trifloxystrobinivorans TaxID=3350256 RepID=UPI003726FB7C
MPSKPAAPADDPSRATSERSYQDLARKIIELSHGDGAADARLPSERTLADMFGVSRTAVREAIIALEVQGLVEVKVGSGIYVLAPGQQAAHGFEIPAGPGPIETLRARALIESEIAGLAARERRDGDLDRLFEALAAMRSHLADKGPYDEADRQFHLAIAEAAGNRVLQHMVQAMWDNARSDPRWDKIEQHFHSQALRETSLQDHQAIFAAISERDSDGARAAMQQHLGRVIQEFSQAWR